MGALLQACLELPQGRGGCQGHGAARVLRRPGQWWQRPGATVGTGQQQQQGPVGGVEGPVPHVSVPSRPRPPSSHALLVR
jgi:hypothetical protein